MDLKPKTIAYIVFASLFLLSVLINIITISALSSKNNRWKDVTSNLSMYLKGEIDDWKGELLKADGLLKQRGISKNPYEEEKINIESDINDIEKSLEKLSKQKGDKWLTLYQEIINHQLSTREKIKIYLNSIGNIKGK